MSGQDLALLLTLQLAILTACALTVHTAWVAAYQRGWEDRQELDPWYRLKRAMRQVGAGIQRAAEHVAAAYRSGQLHVDPGAAQLTRELQSYRYPAKGDR